MPAMPFLTAAKCSSSGLPGAETGFDPLYISDFIDNKWLREAELDTFVSLQWEITKQDGTPGAVDKRFKWAFPEFCNYSFFLNAAT